MAAEVPPPGPDDKRLFDMLCAMGLAPGKAYTFVQELGNMAGHAITAALEIHKAELSAKIDFQNAKIDAQNAKIDAQNSKLNMLMWLIGAAVTVIGILIRLWG